jgi:hypothetical protein
MTDGTTPTTGSSQGTSITLATTGVYTLKYFTVDVAGNAEAVVTAGTQIRVDTTAPTAGTVSVGPFVSGSSVSVTSSGASDADSLIANVLFQAAPSGTTTWTGLAAADTTSPYAATWNTTAGFADGKYDVRAVVTDVAGNSTPTVLASTEVQNGAPTVTSLQLKNGAGSSGVVDKGDQIVLKFSQTLKPSSICNSWNTTGADQSDSTNSSLVTLNDGGSGNDTLTFSTGNTCRLGTVTLGSASYVTSSLSFGGSGSNNRTSFDWDAATGTLTITLGTASSGTVGTVAANTKATWVQSAGPTFITNMLGTALNGGGTTATTKQF